MLDVVKELGFLALGTRFKRIGESLQAQSQALLASNAWTYRPVTSPTSGAGPIRALRCERN